MASMAQPFHPGAMPGHAGMPHGGHPMASGHPSNQGVPGGGQPGVSMGQQMHAGMAGGPGAPQVSQGGQIMAGIPHGTGPPGGSIGVPSAHALSHLNPGHPQQMYTQQQQMQAIASNPQLMQHQQAQALQRQMQQQQQQMTMQRQMVQQQAAAQQQNGGMPMNPGNPGISQAQFNAMQANNPNMRPVSLPVHLQQQLHQQQQQQQQAQQMAHQQQQQQQQHSMAQQMAMHQAASQGGSSQGQPAPQPPMRPPSQMQGPQDPQAIVAAQQAQTQQQQAQQQAQQAAAQQAAQQQAQQAAQQQQQQAQQQAQQQQAQTQAAQQHAQQQVQQQQLAQQQQQAQQAAQQQQQQVQQQAQQAQQQAQQQQDVTAQQVQRQAQVQAQAQAQVQARMQAAQQQAAASMMQPRMPNSLGGHSLLTLLQFGDHLSQFSSRRQQEANDLNYWQGFVDRFFAPSGVLRQQLWDSEKPDNHKTWEVQTPALARYYWTHFNSGVQNLQMITEHANSSPKNNGWTVVECPKSSFIYWFANGCQVMTTGNLRVEFNQNGKIEIMECLVLQHVEYVPRSKIQPAPDSPDQKPSPNMSKNAGKRAAQQRMNKQLQPTQDQLVFMGPPRSPINRWGVTNAVLNLLELAETFSCMENLFHFSQQNPQLSASDALRQLVLSIQNPAQNQPGFNSTMHQQGLNPNIQPPSDQRTPGFNGPNQFASPAAGAHLNLPMNTTASPATINMSPAMHNHPLQNHLQQQPPTSAAMAAQQSHQGTNTSGGTGSQGTSANASPHVPNKRRRPSGVKIETEEMGNLPDINGTAAKVKPSPRIGGKRQKGAS